MIDWTMVSNTNGSLNRIHCIAYLLLERYRFDARSAALKIGAEKGQFSEREKIFDCLRKELKNPTVNLAYATSITDEKVRAYFTEFLDIYDNIE